MKPIWAARVLLVAALLATIQFGKAYLVGSMPALHRIPFAPWRWVPLALLVVPTVIVAVHRRIVGSTRDVDALTSAVWFWLYAVFLAMSTTPPSRGDSFGMLVPYCFAGFFYFAARWSRIGYRDLQVIVTLLASVLAAATVLEAEGLWPWHHVRSPSGLLDNRNFVAEYLAISLASCLSLWSGRRRMLVLLVGVALIWTRCRTAWLAAATGAGLFIVLSGRKAAVAIVVVSLLVALVTPNRLHWTEQRPYAATILRLFNFGNGSGRVRLEQHRETLALMRDHGWSALGPGRWQLSMSRRNPRLALNRIPHSEYLRALVDGGPLGLASLFAILAFAGLAAWRKRAASPEALPMLSVLSVICLADAPLYRLEVCTLVFAFLGCLSRHASAGVAQSPVGTVFAAPFANSFTANR